MYKIIHKSIFIVCIAIAALPTAQAKPPAQKTTLIVNSEQWQDYTLPDGSGYFFEIIKAVYEPLGYNIKYNICPWKRCIRSVLDGHADIAVGLYDDEIGEGSMLILPRYPINLEKVFVAFKAKYPWQGKESLSEQRIVELRGYNYHKELNLPTAPIEANDTHQAWRILMAERAKFYLSDNRQIRWAMDYYNTPKEDISIEPVFQKWAYFAYKDSSRGKELIEAFNQQLPKLYKNGTIQALQHKYKIPWAVPLHDTSSQQ